MSDHIHLCVTSYGAWLDECKERTKRGEKQLHCGLCGKWRWPGECEHDRSEMLDTRAFNRMVRETAKAVRAEREAKR